MSGMLDARAVIDRLARRVGGPRVLALPLLRTLALLAAVAWVTLAPADLRSPALVLTVVGFVVYSAVVEAALWWKPGATLRLNLWVLLIDQVLALTLIHLTGGVRSALYLALALIAALQSYYYGIKRGVAVAVISAAAYLVVIWPTIQGVDIPNTAIRAMVLLGAAISVGILADLELRERAHVMSLTVQANDRERYIRSVVESLREGLIALDLEGRVLAWNRAMEQWCGVPGEALMGRPLFDVNPNFKTEAVAEPLRKLLRGDIEEFKLDGVAHETLRGEHVAWNVRGGLIRQGAQAAGAVLLIEDITQRVGLERVARQSEKLAALGTLAAGLAHELNNPIGIISSRAELMLLEGESAPLSPEVAEDLRVIHRHAQRVARIAQGLLSFSRNSPGERGRVDLNQVVDETLLLAEKMIVKDGVMLRRALAPGLPPIWGDANALQQVVMNLVTNARDAVKGGGEISIETSIVSERSDGVQLIVQDTGPGIPPEILPKIFDPFFTTKAEGTGLGLSISYGIVREHQGTVDVQSAPGKGTTFVLTFRSARPGELA
jgi:PAS domain S-box-containing protein